MRLESVETLRAGAYALGLSLLLSATVASAQVADAGEEQELSQEEYHNESDPERSKYSVKVDDELPESRYLVLHEGHYTQNSFQTNKQIKVLPSQAAYESELPSYTSAAPRSLDFAQGKVLLVDMGARPSGGYAVAISSIEVSTNWVRANIELIVPGRDCFVTAAITHPYLFAYIPTRKEILVSERLEAASC